ncbi:MAG: radical SAM protein [Fervidicoccaceae archaeon]
MGSLAKRLERAISAKVKLRDAMASRLDEASLRRAESDPHARRRPRPCGLTIHPAIGCTRGCLYCYVPSVLKWGRTSRVDVELSDLMPEELALALLANPYFLPGPEGTLLAVGSVTDPFLDERVTSRTLSYLRAIRDVLGNPVQVATKSVLSGEELEELRRSAEPRTSVLVTVISLRLARVLEPRAPPPMERLEFLGRLAEAGLSPALFMRPLLPGVPSEELREIMRICSEKGVRDVVLGSLQVDGEILAKLRAAPRIAAEVERRVGPTGPGLSPIRAPELKTKAARLAEELDLRAHPASCSASVSSHGLSCARCRMGPCGVGCPPPIEEDDAREALEALGLEVVEVRAGEHLEALIKGERSRARLDVLEELIETIARRRARLRLLS